MRLPRPAGAALGKWATAAPWPAAALACRLIQRKLASMDALTGTGTPRR
jgi:hypothetical protein